MQKINKFIKTNYDYLINIDYIIAIKQEFYDYCVIMCDGREYKITDIEAEKVFEYLKNKTINIKKY